MIPYKLTPVMKKQYQAVQDRVWDPPKTVAQKLADQKIAELESQKGQRNGG